MDCTEIPFSLTESNADSCEMVVFIDSYTWKCELNNEEFGASRREQRATLTLFDWGETERALLRRLLGEIEAGAMETLPYFLSLGRVHPGRNRRCFLIRHVASPFTSAPTYSIMQLMEHLAPTAPRGYIILVSQSCLREFQKGAQRFASLCADSAQRSACGSPREVYERNTKVSLILWLDDEMASPVLLITGFGVVFAKRALFAVRDDEEPLTLNPKPHQIISD